MQRLHPVKTGLIPAHFYPHPTPTITPLSTPPLHPPFLKRKQHYRSPTNTERHTCQMPVKYSEPWSLKCDVFPQVRSIRRCIHR